MKHRRGALGLAITMGGCLALFLAWAVPALADDDERSEPEFRMDIDSVMFVHLDRNELEFNPTANDLINGRTTPEQLTATVSSNTDWVLSIAGSATKWDGPWDKPVGDILWRIAGSENYTPLATSAAEVERGAPVKEYGVSLDFAVALDMARDLAGTYRYESVVFQVSAQ